MFDTTAPADETTSKRARPGWLAARFMVPPALFLLYLLWGWRNWHLFTEIPAYGDVLEIVWGWEWYAGALREGYSPFFYDLVFHPEGWHTATLAHSPYFFLLSLPLYWLGGPAFAYNLIALAGLGIAYMGMYLAARRYVPWFPASLAAVAFTFSWPLFLRAANHLNILLGAALLPWLLWMVVRAQQEGVTGRNLLLAGLIWGLSICFSFYFLFLGGLVLLVCWLFPAGNGQTRRSWTHWRGLFSVALVAFLFNLPLFILFWQARQADAVAAWDVAHLNLWGMHVNTVFGLPAGNPAIRPLLARFFENLDRESAQMGLGLVGGLLALASLRYWRREPQLRAPAALLIIGLVLALGVYLKWDGRTIQVPTLVPVNQALWQLGHVIKPQLFPGDLPPGELAAGIPLPNLLLVALAPFWEGVRTTTRFAFLAWLAVPILAAFVLNRISLRPLRYGLMLLWLFEIIPVPTHTGLPLPDTPHPAHAWLAENPLPAGAGIIDLYTNQVLHDGSTLYATRFHRQPTASGVGSQWPAHTAALESWYRENGPLHPDFRSILQDNRIRYLLLTSTSEQDNHVIGQLQLQEDFQLIDCFLPNPAPSPWPYPICVIEVRE